MKRTTRASVVAALALLTASAASVPAGAQTPAASPRAVPRANRADVQFMQGMIAHHAQAITMSALVPSHTPRDAMHLLAERITVSQRDEIALMRGWLVAHGETAPDPMASHDMHHDMPGMAGMPGMAASDSGAMMPGMLTPEQFAALGAASGTAFERLFLQSMIRHHEGALTMVTRLFASTGAAQDGDVFRFASDVDVDQRAEIVRMRTLLAALPTH